MPFIKLPLAFHVVIRSLTAIGLGLVFPALSAGLQFPTGNHFLLDPGQWERFYTGTAGQPWMSGQFGCVRSSGRQIHEGIDIQCLERDSGNEPADPILAVADGTVAYVNSKAGLSNYGKYIVVQHDFEGLEIHSLYAHLSEIAEDVRPGTTLAQGQRIGVMGRTANTRQPITKDRAHLHFEMGILVTRQFEDWYEKTYPGNRNDHGIFHGYNLLGFDPAQVFLDQAASPESFRFVDWTRERPEAFRVFVRKPDFKLIRRFILLVKRNPKAEQEGVAGFEIGLTFNGFPYQFIPRSPSEVQAYDKDIHLISVNESQWKERACRDYLQQHGDRWRLSPDGVRLIELLTY